MISVELFQVQLVFITNEFCKVFISWGGSAAVSLHMHSGGFKGTDRPFRFKIYLCFGIG